MKATKSIFDKSYIVEAQAIAAGAKEWPQGAPADVALSKDEATKKFRWMKAAPIPQFEDETHPELAAAELEMPADVVEMQAKADRQADADLIEEHVPGFSHCPSCGIHLSNGVCIHGDEVNGTPLVHDTNEYACLGCGAEFGPAIGAKRTIQKLRFSTCERPTKKVWHIADAMPMATRKEVMAECVAQGIAYGTARTQYQAWFKASQECERLEVRKPYQKGE